MKSLKLAKLIGVCLCALALMACSQASSPSGSSSSSSSSSVSIKSIGYYAVNTPSDWWSASSSIKPGLSYNFSVVFDGTVSRSDLASAKIYAPDLTTWWKIDLDSFDPNTNKLSDTGFCLSSNLNELPVGTMKAQVTLTNGSVLEKTFTMGVPGSTTNGSYNYVKNEEVISSTLTPATVALARPAISSFSFSNSSFTVVFVANDTNRHNGWIWFYTNTGIFVGYSPYFLDGKTGECFSGFNSGHGFQSLNTVVLTNSDIVDSNGYAISASNFNLIKQCRVVITDGKQFEPTSYNNYAYRAISSCSTVN